MECKVDEVVHHDGGVAKRGLTARHGNQPNNHENFHYQLSILRVRNIVQFRLKQQCKLELPRRHLVCHRTSLITHTHSNTVPTYTRTCTHSDTHSDTYNIHTHTVTQYLRTHAHVPLEWLGAEEALILLYLQSIYLYTEERKSTVITYTHSLHTLSNSHPL